MSSLFRRLMRQATRMPSAADLRRTTAAVQAALLRGVLEPAPPKPAKRHRAATFDTAWPPKSQPSAPAVLIRGTHAEPAGVRDYLLFAPPREASASLRPLVVMLHGCKQNPEDFAAGTRMNEAAAQQGFCVLYPGQSLRMNPARCWNWFKRSHQQRGRGEASILAGMTATVIANHGIDPQRVFVAGLSAGGAMAAILGDAYPEMFAAVGVHSGLPTGAASDMAGAFAAMSKGSPGASGAPTRGSRSPRGPTPPTIVFHGDADTTVHPVNGEHVIAACASSATAGSAGVQKTVTRGHSAGGQDYTREVYQDRRGRPLAELWRVHGAGHAWSGGSPAGSYTDAAGPDATGAMLAFFFSQRGPVVV